MKSKLASNIIIFLIILGTAFALCVFVTGKLKDTQEVPNELSPTQETASLGDSSEPQEDEVNTNQEDNQSEAINKPMNKNIVILKTSQGDIKIELFSEDAPKTVNNFLKLAGEGFYDGVIFHRVIDGFMIQGGDPTGTGMGGPGYTFGDELNPETESYKRGYVKGTVAMANAGPNTNGSQFFIMVRDYPLSHDYTIFGRVIEGQDVADKIAKVPTNKADRPLEDVVIVKASVD
jgi:cyclophilin family peptidyl-prolyl cis-trans isomerase